MHLTKLGSRIHISTSCHNISIRNSSKVPKTRLIASKDQLSEIKQNFFRDRAELTPVEWTNVTNLLLEKYRHISQHNVDSVIIGVCSDSRQLSLAKNFIHYLKGSEKGPNDATLGKLLRIYNGVYHDRGGRKDSLTQQEQKEILEIYDKFRSKHDVLDAMSCENLIFGLVGTTKWKDGLQLMDMMKVTASPTLSAFTELIVKAFNMGEMSLGWRLLEEMVEQRKQPKCEIFLEYLRVINNDAQTLPAEFEKLLKFIEYNELVITEKVAKAFSKIAVQHRSVLTVTCTRLKRFGKCTACNNFLQNISLSDEDFEKLRSAFLDKVLLRNDIFRRSTPEEVEAFRNYVNKTGPYDCVVDGLNVAYSMGAKKPVQVIANLLANVVKYFKKKEKHVLVLGRKHMNNWPQKPMRYVKENAAMFLANDLSQDDPFLLYATLKSGQTTDFFSRDFMRQHAFLLGPDLKPIFRRWQQEHQYSLVTQTESGKIVVKEPIRHLICAHKVGNHWHVPYKNEYSMHAPDSFEMPEHWLCIKFGEN